LFDPTSESRGDLVERKWKGAASQKKSVSTEADQIERVDVMLAGQRLDVVPPPVRGTAEPVQQEERRPIAGFTNPE